MPLGGICSALCSRDAWLVAGFVVLSRALLLVFAKWLPGDDGEVWLNGGLNFYKYGYFSNDYGPSPPPTAVQPPAYQLLLAGLVALFRDVQYAVVAAAFVNTVFFALVSIGVYVLAILLTDDRRVGFFAGAVFVMLPEGFPYALFYMADCMYLFFVVFSCVSFVCFFRFARRRYLIVAFILLGCSILVKHQAAYFSVVFALLLLVHRQKQAWRQRLAWMALGMVVQMAVIAPWIARNYYIFGVARLTYQVDVHVYEFLYPILLQEMGEDPKAIQSQARV